MHKDIEFIIQSIGISLIGFSIYYFYRYYQWNTLWDASYKYTLITYSAILITFIGLFAAIYKSIYLSSMHPYRNIIVFMIIVYSACIFYYFYPWINNLITSSIIYQKQFSKTKLKHVQVSYKVTGHIQLHKYDSKIVDVWLKKYKQYYDGSGYGMKDKMRDHFWYDVPFKKALQMKSIMKKHQSEIRTTVHISNMIS